MQLGDFRHRNTGKKVTTEKDIMREQVTLFVTSCQQKKIIDIYREIQSLHMAVLIRGTSLFTVSLWECLQPSYKFLHLPIEMDNTQKKGGDRHGLLNSSLIITRESGNDIRAKKEE